MLKDTIDQILPGTAARLPDKPALIFGGRTYTYRQLERLSNQAANGLKALGVRKGDRVTLFAQNCAEWVISYIGIAKAGGVLNPVNAMLTADELAYVVKDCGARVLITTSERAKRAKLAIDVTPTAMAAFTVPKPRRITMLRDRSNCGIESRTSTARMIAPSTLPRADPATRPRAVPTTRPTPTATKAPEREFPAP